MLKIFGHYIPRALLLLYLSEITVLFNSILLAILVTATFIKHDILVLYHYSGIQIAVISYILIMQLAMIVTGLYQRDLPSEPTTIILRIVLSFILGIMLFVPLANWMQLDTLNRDVLILAFSCAFIGIIASRLLLCRNQDNTPGHCRALVLGSGENAAQLETLWADRKLPKAHSLFGTDTHIEGYIDTNGGELAKVSKDKLVKLDGKSLCSYAKDNKIIEIIIAMDERRLIRLGEPLA